MRILIRADLFLYYLLIIITLFRHINYTIEFMIYTVVINVANSPHESVNNTVDLVPVDTRRTIESHSRSIDNN